MTVTANGERFTIRAGRRRIIHQLLTGPTLDSEVSGDDISHSLSVRLQIFQSAGETWKQKREREKSAGPAMAGGAPDRRSEK